MGQKRVKNEFCKSGEGLVRAGKQLQASAVGKLWAPRTMLAAGKERLRSLEEGEVCASSVTKETSQRICPTFSSKMKINMPLVV